MAGTILSTKKTENGVALSVQVWKEGPTYVAYSPELDISSCGNSAARAKSALREAVALFIEEATRRAPLMKSSREQKKYGAYRTARLVLTAFDELSKSGRFRGEKRNCTMTDKTWTVGD